MSLLNLFESQKSTLLKYGLNRLKRRELVDEVLQDTAARLMNLSAQPENPKALIFKTFIWALKNKVRGLKNQRHYNVEEVELSVTENPMANLESKQYSELLRLGISALPKKQKQIIESYLEGIGPREYARLNGLNEFTASAHYRHGLVALREFLKG